MTAPARIVSFGCRLNAYESEAMRAALGDAPDTLVINTCAVTAEAVRQAECQGQGCEQETWRTSRCRDEAANEQQRHDAYHARHRHRGDGQGEAGACGQGSGQDFDKDGMPNGVEYFMGATGSSFTPNPPIAGGTVTCAPPLAVTSALIDASPSRARSFAVTCSSARETGRPRSDSRVSTSNATVSERSEGAALVTASIWVIKVFT